MIDVQWSDRWQVYYRLQELGISCHCEVNQPLTAEFSHPSAAIQLWSVIKPYTHSRSALLQWLDHCWHL